MWVAIGLRGLVSEEGLQRVYFLKLILRAGGVYSMNHFLYVPPLKRPMSVSAFCSFFWSKLSF